MALRTSSPNFFSPSNGVCTCRSHRNHRAPGSRGSYGFECIRSLLLLAETSWPLRRGTGSWGLIQFRRRYSLSWRSHHPLFKLGRTDLAEGRVSSSLVTAYLDEVEEGHLGLAATEAVVVSKNTNGFKIHVPGCFGLEVPRLGSPREARILGRYGVAADGPGPEPHLAVWTADVPPLPDLTVTPSAGSPVRTRRPQT